MFIINIKTIITMDKSDNDSVCEEFPLIIDESKMNEYFILSNTNLEEVPEQHRLAYRIAIDSLKSNECNEPYERLLSSQLGLVNVEEKHGWDGIDNLENTKNVYEYKPSSKKNAPSGTINDDSISKIEKCENLPNDGKSGWLILAGIDKEKFNFKVIYKFPIHIYNADRRKYLQNMIEKNKTKEKQTRITYSITVKKSIKLCNQFSVPYYVWTNN
jgi:hypothetical protein